MTAKVPRAYASPRRVPGMGSAPAFAASVPQYTISFAATEIRVVPITVSNVPVTTGGKKRRSFAKKGAARKVAMPATIIEPYIVARPSTPPPAAKPTAISGETAVNVTP